jgi:hypothetical protein
MISPVGSLLINHLLGLLSLLMVFRMNDTGLKDRRSHFHASRGWHGMACYSEKNSSEKTPERLHWGLSE